METPFAHLLHHNSSSMMKNFSNLSFSNTSLPESDWKNDVKPVLDYLLLVILIVVMLAMGCEITWRNIWDHVKRPLGLLIGLVCQFLLKPVCAFGFLKLTQIDGLYATGVLIIACCPGGVLSNTFTYFCDGDLGLSVTMTTASTILAMGMMPANLWIYGRSFESETLVIPYKEMALSLISVTSPVIVGMVLKMKVPSVAKWAAKIGSYSGLGIMIICIVIEVVVFPNMFDNVPWEIYALSVALPILGLGLGYLLAFFGKQNMTIRKTVAIECGVQNVPVALTIIAMSFPLEMQEDIILLPWLYGFIMVIGCTVLCLVYNFIKKRKDRTAEERKRELALRQKDEEETEDLIEKNGVQICLKNIGPVIINGKHKTDMSIEPNTINGKHKTDINA